jgi:CRISPR/Cas system-associated exonuclease Cas4 (RecB family)
MIITISPSSIESLQSCPAAYNFSSVLRLRPLEEDTSKMDRGTCFHKMLKTHYNLILAGLNDPATRIPYSQINLAVIEVAREFTRNDEFPHEMVEECIGNYNDYCIFYSSDGWTPKAVETPFSTELYSDENIKVILEGVIDLVVETSDGVTFPVDHKTVSQNDRNPTILSNQFMAYCWALNSKNFVKNDIGFQKTYGPKDRFHRHVMSYDDTLLDEWKNNVILDIMKTIGYKENDYWPRNYSNCKYCRYKRICETTPDSRQYKIETLYRKGEQFDIYAAR